MERNDDHVRGVSAFWLGEPYVARHFLSAALDAHAEPIHPSMKLDAHVSCLGHLACALTALGHLRTARTVSVASLALAERGDAAVVGRARLLGAMLALELREGARFRKIVTSLEDMDRALSSEPTAVAAYALNGLVEVFDGRVEPGIARVEAAAREAEGLDHSSGTPAMLARMLMAAHAMTRDPARGLEAADRALVLTGRMLVWGAEVRRVRAELLRATGGSSREVAAELSAALAIAEQQGAALFALRTAVSATHHYIADGDIEARDAMLGRVAIWFDAVEDSSEVMEGLQAVRLMKRPT